MDIKNQLWNRQTRKMWPLLLPVLLYLPGIFGSIAFPSPEAEYTDMLLAHYPNVLFLKETILHEHQLPFWNPHIFSGTPFAANPLAGLWYLPGWMGMLFSLPEGLYFMAAAHVVWAGIGGYLYLRKDNVHHLGALMGGLSIALLPKISAHLGTGHLTLIYAFSWTPWLFYVSKMREEGWLSGLVIGAIFLADPRWLSYSVATWVMWVLFISKGEWKRKLTLIIEAGMVGILIAAPLLLPLIQFTAQSTRTHLTPHEILEMSLPPQNAVNLLLPAWNTNPEWVCFAGGVSILFFIVAVVKRQLRSRLLFWLGIVFLSFLIALGKYIPGSMMIAKMPGLSLLRVPARALFLTGFGMAIITGITVDKLLLYEINPKTIRLVSFGGLVFSALFFFGILGMVGRMSEASYWGLGWLFFSALLLFSTQYFPKKQFLGWALVISQIVGLLITGWMYPDWREHSEFVPQKVIDKITTDENVRIYSPSYSIPQSQAVEEELELVYGVDPLQYQPYVHYFSRASGIPERGYSVTLPPFPAGNPKEEHRLSIPDLNLLGLLNVRYILSAYPIAVGDLKELYADYDSYLYQNENYLPRVWIEEQNNEGIKTGERVIDRAQILEMNPNQLRIRAMGPGTLIVSEISYPGWKVRVDHQPQDLRRAYEILRSIDLPDGEHIIEISYRPLTVYLGIVFALIGLLYCGWRRYS